MTSFFRFPHTPHLAWLGDGQPRADKLLAPTERDALLARSLLVEEKIDGANVGFSVDEELTLRVQNRGSLLDERSSPPQFRPLWSWLAPRREALVESLWPDRTLFGEWCAFRHSVAYDALPDWFLGFDVHDRARGVFLDSGRRDDLLTSLGLAGVPRLGRGRFSIEDLQAMIGPSRLGSDTMEGLVIRLEGNDSTIRRAKLVRPAFVQRIDTHWSRLPPHRNALVAYPGGEIEGPGWRSDR